MYLQLSLSHYLKGVLPAELRKSHLFVIKVVQTTQI